MKPLDLTGANTLVVTPFAQNGDLDLLSLRYLIDTLIENGATGIILLGSTGEFFALTHQEKICVIEHGIQHVAGRVPVTVGVGSEGTAGSIALARKAESLGADCIMVIPPIYFDPSPAAQITHYVALARSVTIDIMLYDGANGIHLTPETLSRVKTAAPNVRYVKIASQDPSLFTLFAERVPDVLTIIGDDMMLLQGLSLGGQGSATAIGNILPRRISALHGFFLDGDMDSARQTAVFLAPITMMLSIPKTGFIAKFKYILFKQSILTCEHVRSPLSPLTDFDRQYLDDVVIPLVANA